MLGDSALILESQSAQAMDATGWRMDVFVSDVAASFIQQHSSIPATILKPSMADHDALLAQAISFSGRQEGAKISSSSSYFIGDVAFEVEYEKQINIDRLKTIANKESIDLIVAVVPASIRVATGMKMMLTHAVPVFQTASGYGRFYVDAQMGPFIEAAVLIIDAKTGKLLSQARLRDQKRYFMKQKKAVKRDEFESNGHDSDTYYPAHHKPSEISDLPDVERSCLVDEVKIIVESELKSAISSMGLTQLRVNSTRPSSVTNPAPLFMSNYFSPCDARDQTLLKVTQKANKDITQEQGDAP